MIHPEVAKLKLGKTYLTHPRNNSYSIIIEHLPRIASPHKWEKVDLAMFTAYFDASGDDHRQKLLAVAGFVASAAGWIDWEKEWLSRLREDGLEMLHVAELIGHFNGDRDKKQHLIDNLCEITYNHVAYKFGVTVINSELNAAITKQDREKLRINAYSLGGRTVAGAVRLWANSWGGSFPQLVFEQGDKGIGHLTHTLTSQGYPRPIVKPKKSYVDKKSGILHEAAVPLQAADLLAYDLFSCGRGDEGRDRLNYFHIRISGVCGTVEVERSRFIKQGLEQKDSLIMLTDVKIDTKGGSQ